MFSGLPPKADANCGAHACSDVPCTAVTTGACRKAYGAQMGHDSR
jgi:hypothetical protein